MDLLPTLLESYEITPPPDLHGHSLLSVARGKPVNLREYACSWTRARTGAEWAIRTHQWYLILPMSETDTPPRQPQLYVKPDDRWEVNNVLEQHQEVADHLELTLRRFLAACREDRLAGLPGLREDILKIVQS
jgi:arylsulfatase A-like enzyme